MNDLLKKKKNKDRQCTLCSNKMTFDIFFTDAAFAKISNAANHSSRKREIATSIAFVLHCRLMAYEFYQCFKCILYSTYRF